MRHQQIDTSRKREISTDFVRNNPETPSRQLARMLYRKHKSLFPSWDAAYQAIRRRRGAQGDAHRKKSMKYHAATFQDRTGFVWKMPKSLAEPWSEYELPQGTTLCLQDAHVPFHDDAAMAAVFDHARKLDPDTILFNGDMADFYGVSRWDRNPSKEDLWGELQQSRAVLGTFRQEFPRAKIIWKLGNHEERWEHYIWKKAKELWELPFTKFEHMMTGAIPESDDENNPRTAQPQIGSKENGDQIIFVKDQRIIRAGKHLGILHGHELPQGTSSPVNFARTLFLKTMECCIAGHHHRSSQHDGRTMFGRQIACWSTGCLCDLTPDYRRINQWNHGFAVIIVRGEKFEVQNLRVIKGKVY